MKPLLSTKHTAYRIPCFLLVALVFSYIICLENVWSIPEHKNLRVEIDAILQKYKPKGTSVGISIFSVSRNKSLYKSNSSKPFVVASNMKLFTTATALVYLGADFEYETEIYYSGDISEDGKLDGDIIINTIAIANAKFLPRIEVYRKIIYEAFEFSPKGKQISFHHIKR